MTNECRSSNVEIQNLAGIDAFRTSNFGLPSDFVIRISDLSYLLPSISYLLRLADRLRHFAHFAQVQFAGAKVWEGFDVEELVGARFPKIGQVGLGELFEAGLELAICELVQHNQALTF